MHCQKLIAQAYIWRKVYLNNIMPSVKKIDIPVVPRFFHEATSTTGYLYENLLTENEFNSLLAYWEQFHVQGVDFDQCLYK